MTNKGKYNMYWFFRSFSFSSLIFGCLLALLIGSAQCYAIMQSESTGREVEVVSWDGKTFSLLGREIYKNETALVR